MRLETHASLAKLDEAHKAADRAQLFRSAERLSHLQREFIRFKDLGDGRPEMARRLVRKIERAEEVLHEEHEDVDAASRSSWRARRGLISVCALFGAQLVNLATQLLMPDAFGTVPDFLKGYVHQSIAVALTALAAFPIRDFLIAYRFAKAKEMADGALGGLKKELLASLGSLKMEKEAGAKPGAQ